MPYPIRIQGGIYAATLDYSLPVKLSLPVSYKVYFFDTQFSPIFVRSQKYRISVKMFNKGTTPELLNKFGVNTMISTIGIEFTEVGDNYLSAKMPVDERTVQALGTLHGGASLTLAETLGSVAAYMTLNHETHFCVGLEINGNHIKSVTSGFVYGKATPLHIGNKTQVWEIRITNENQELINISRLTLAILEKKNSQ